MLIAGLPSQPSEYAMLPGAWGPRPRTRKLIGMLGVILAAIALIMVGYLAVGLAGYLAFRSDVKSNVLNSFDPHDKLMLVRSALTPWFYLFCGPAPSPEVLSGPTALHKKESRYPFVVPP